MFQLKETIDYFPEFDYSLSSSSSFNYITSHPNSSTHQNILSSPLNSTPESISHSKFYSDIIKWFYSYDTETKLKLISISDQQRILTILSLYSKYTQHKKMKFKLKFNDIELIGSKHLLPFSTKIDTNNPMPNEKRVTVELFLKEIKFISLQKEIDVMTLSPSLLNDQGMFEYFFMVFSRKHLFENYTEVKMSNSNNSNSNSDEKIFTCEIPSWLAKKDYYSLCEIIVGFFEMELNAKYYAFKSSGCKINVCCSYFGVDDVLNEYIQKINRIKKYIRSVDDLSQKINVDKVITKAIEAKNKNKENERMNISRKIRHYNDSLNIKLFEPPKEINKDVEVQKYQEIIDNGDTQWVNDIAFMGFNKMYSTDLDKYVDEFLIQELDKYFNEVEIQDIINEIEKEGKGMNGGCGKGKKKKKKKNKEGKKGGDGVDSNNNGNGKSIVKKESGEEGLGFSGEHCDDKQNCERDVSTDTTDINQNFNGDKEEKESIVDNSNNNNVNNDNYVNTNNECQNTTQDKDKDNSNLNQQLTNKTYMNEEDDDINTSSTEQTNSNTNNYITNIPTDINNNNNDPHSNINNIDNEHTITLNNNNTNNTITKKKKKRKKHNKKPKPSSSSSHSPTSLSFTSQAPPPIPSSISPLLLTQPELSQIQTKFFNSHTFKPIHFPYFITSPKTPKETLHNLILTKSNSIITSLSNTKNLRYLSLILLCNEIKKCFPSSELSLTIYGSYSTGTAIDSSDIDLSIELINKNSNTIPVIESLINSLYIHLTSLNNPTFNNLNPITTARVPILKLEMNYEQTLTKIDLTFNLTTCIPSMEYNNTLLQTYPEIKPLYMLIKLLLKKQKLNNSFEGGLSSHSLFLMISSYIKVLKTNTHINISFKQNLGDFLIDIFHFYGTFFNYNKTLIDITKDYPYIITDRILKIPLFIDPISKINTAKSFFEYEKLKELFCKCETQLTSHMNESEIVNSFKGMFD